MIFVFTCKDKPDHLQVRLDKRPAHVAHLEELNAAGTLKFAGPFLDESGKPCGSLVAVEVPDMAGARSLAESDPYAKAGLFETVDIRAWNWVFNKPSA